MVVHLAVRVCLFSLFLLVSSSILAVPKRHDVRRVNRSSIAGCSACAGLRKARRSVPCHPRSYVDPRISKNYNAALRDMRRAGVKPTVTSAWRSSAQQAALHRCTNNRVCRRRNPGIYYAMPPGSSAHEAGLAVDISGIAAGPRGAKRLTPRGRKIVHIMQKNGFNWRYGLKDPAHFEVSPRRVGYRNLNAAIRKTQSTCTVRLGKRRG